MLKLIGNAVLLLFVLLVLTGCGNSEPTATSMLPTAVITTRAGSTTPSSSSTPLSGSYLGQATPGSSPVIFAREIISGELHTPPVFAPDGSEAYWGMQGKGIYVTKFENGSWTRPANVTFSASMTDYRDPFLAPSGDRLFFLSKGRIPGSKLPEKENIWFVERTGDGWGEPQPLSEEVNSHETHWQLSVDNKGNLYFTSRKAGLEDIYVSRYANGQYVTPEKLSDAVNTEDLCEMTPYIAPDGGYLIFSRYDPKNSSTIRLYISYAEDNGGWTRSALIAKIRYGLCPVVTPDGKYLLFLSSPQTVSWMNTEFIEALRPSVQKPSEVSETP
jgi:hypothetical protein